MMSTGEEFHFSPPLSLPLSLLLRTHAAAGVLPYGTSPTSRESRRVTES